MKHHIYANMLRTYSHRYEVNVICFLLSKVTKITNVTKVTKVMSIQLQKISSLSWKKKFSLLNQFYNAAVTKIGMTT